MKIIYDEWYGNLSFAQRTAYRKFNVTPAEHDELARHFGQDGHSAITEYVKQHSANGHYEHPWRGFS